MPNTTGIISTVAQALNWLANDIVIAIATFVGTALSALGLFFSFHAFVQAKQAKQAAFEAKQAVYHVDSLSEITKALSTMDDIQAHFRCNNLMIIPDKILTARALLTTVRHSCPGLTEKDQERVLQSCNQMSTIKSALEKVLQEKKTTFSYAQYNDILTKQRDIVQDILESIKRREA